MRRILGLSVPLVVTVACSLSGGSKDHCLTDGDCNAGRICVSGTCTSASGLPDAGPPADAAADTALPLDAPSDVGHDAPNDSGKPDGRAEGGTVPTGQPLVTETNGSLSLYGVTSDGWAIYLDVPTDTVSAAPLDGGASQTLVLQVDGPNTSQWGGENSRVQVSGSTVLIGQNNVPSGNVLIATLAAWSASAGSGTLSSGAIVGGNLGVPLGTSTAYVGSYAVTDGVHVAFLEQTSSGKSIASLKVSMLDGTPVATVLQGIDGSSDTTVSLGFVGATLVAVTGQASADASAALSLVTATGPDWQPVQVLTAGQVFAAGYGYLSDAVWRANPAQTELALLTDTGLKIVDLATNTVTYTDPSATLGPVNASPSFSIFPLAPAPAVFVSPSSFAYVSMPDGGAGASLSLSSGGAPTSLGPGASVFTVSNDGKQTLGAAGDLSSFFFASPSGSGQVAVSFPTTLWPLNDAFTTDSSHALFFDESDLYACPVGPGSSVALTPISSNLPQIGRAATGAEVVYNDNPNMTSFISDNDLVTADLNVIDLAAASPTPRRIASQTNETFFLSPAGDQVVFVWGSSPLNAEGLYVQALP